MYESAGFLRSTFGWLCYASGTFALVIVAVTCDAIVRSGRLGCSFARRLWGPLVLRSFGVRLHAEGYDPRKHDRPAVFVANHQSAVDIPALFAASPFDLRFVAKEEVRYLPFIGIFMMVNGHVFVKRGDRPAATRALTRAAERVARGTRVVVFAEGTRSDDLGLLPFKKGAFVLAIQAGVPIIPVVVDRSGFAVPKRRMYSFPGPIYVSFGDPIPTEGLRYEDRDELRERVHRAMQAQLAELRRRHPPPRPLPLVAGGPHHGVAANEDGEHGLRERVRAVS